MQINKIAVFIRRSNQLFPISTKDFMTGQWARISFGFEGSCWVQSQQNLLSIFWPATTSLCSQQFPTLPLVRTTIHLDPADWLNSKSSFISIKTHLGMKTTLQPNTTFPSCSFRQAHYEEQRGHKMILRIQRMAENESYTEWWERWRECRRWMELLLLDLIDQTRTKHQEETTQRQKIQTGVPMNRHSQPKQWPK